jgi:hypothetical protein
VSRANSTATATPQAGSVIVVDTQLDTGINVSNPAMVGVVSAPVTLGPGLQPIGETDLSAAGQGSTDPNANMTVDFGFIPAVKLGNLVWIDTGTGGGTANDGVQNGTEPGLNGVTVTVRTPAGILVGTAVTANNPVTGLPGWYEFTLPPGSYQVEFTPPSGYSFTSQGSLATPGSTPSDTSNSQPTAANPRTVVVNLPVGGDQNLQLDAGVVLNTATTVTPVPTLNQWMLGFMVLMVMTLGLRRMRRS